MTIGTISDLETAKNVKVVNSPLPIATDSFSVYNGTEALTPKFAAIDVTANGNNTLVAAVANRKIRVLAIMLIAAGTVNVRFESGAGGAGLTGQMQLTAQVGFVLPFSPVGWFETFPSQLLNLELSDTISIDGCLVYVEV